MTREEWLRSGRAEATARWWLRCTTWTHAVVGCFMLCSWLLLCLAARQSRQFLVSSQLAHALELRLAATALVTAAAKSCKGAQLTARKLLNKLPRVLLAKTLDLCLSALAWLSMLPLLLSYHPRSTAILLFYAVVAANAALDALGSIVVSIRRHVFTARVYLEMCAGFF